MRLDRPSGFRHRPAARLIRLWAITVIISLPKATQAQIQTKGHQSPVIVGDHNVITYQNPPVELVDLVDSILRDIRRMHTAEQRKHTQELERFIKAQGTANTEFQAGLMERLLAIVQTTGEQQRKHAEEFSILLLAVQELSRLAKDLRSEKGG